MLSAIPATRSSLERAYWVGLTLLAGLLLSTSLPPWIRALLAPLYLGSTASVLYRQGKGSAKEPAHFIESPQDSETHLRLALTASRTGVWDWDMVTDRLYWSPEACAIFGSGPVEQLQDFAQMVHPEDSPGLWQEVDAAVAEHRLMSTEFRAFRPDGRMVWMLGHGQVFFGSDGKPVKMLGTVTDITARRESEQQFRALFELSPEPVLIQTEGRLAMVNPALVRLLGAESAEELIGQELLERVHPESRPQIESLLRDGQSPDRPALLVRFLRLDGAPVDVEACIAPFMHANTMGAQFILRDVTERLQAEAERRALESKMRECQKMEAIGQLAGGVAHDFNNLLTVIEGNATLIQKSAELRPETGVLTAEVLQAARRASVLTQQLLLFSRKKAMELRNLRLSEVTANALHLLRRLLGEDVTIEARLGSNLPPVLADEVMLEQVIMNLAINARDAMAGAGVLTLQTSLRPDGRVCLSVSDTGCGIAPEVLPHIFEPFFTTKAAGRGTGLGLATVFGIAEQHQASLEVDSVVARGTTFHFVLPAAVEKRAARPAETAPVAGGGDETILLVEDESALRRLAARILSGAGYKVLSAATGPEALTLWEQHRTSIALIVSDMVMPGGMSGLQLGERLRLERPELKVLLSSGYSQDLLAERSDAPASEAMFLSKPYTPQKLLETVRYCLDLPLPGA